MAGKVQVARRERLHRLCKSIIADPRSVDVGTVAEFKSAALKYVATQYADTTQGLKDLYKVEGELGDLVRGAFDVVVSKRLDNMEISPLTGAAYNRTRQLLDDDEDDDDARGEADDVTKARTRHDVGGKGLASAVSEHVLDMIDFHRRRLGIAKSGGQPEESNMRTSESLESILKDSSPVSVCKAIVDRGRSPCGEAELVAALSKNGDRAFAKLYEAEESVRRACSIAKAAEFSVFDIKPVVVGGPDEMHEANDDDDSAVLRAHEEIVRIGREKFPFLRADQQFARVMEDKNYAALAAQAHRRPGPTTVYAMPRAAAYTKADPTPNTDTAYAELMLKAEAYRKVHPELSISQAFEKVFTAPAHRELVKRERMESAPR